MGKKTLEERWDENSRQKRAFTNLFNPKEGKEKKGPWRYRGTVSEFGPPRIQEPKSKPESRIIGIFTKNGIFDFNLAPEELVERLKQDAREYSNLSYEINGNSGSGGKLNPDTITSNAAIIALEKARTAAFNSPAVSTQEGAGKAKYVVALGGGLALCAGLFGLGMVLRGNIDEFIENRLDDNEDTPTSTPSPTSTLTQPTAVVRTLDSSSTLPTTLASKSTPTLGPTEIPSEPVVIDGSGSTPDWLRVYTPTELRQALFGDDENVTEHNYDRHSLLNAYSLLTDGGFVKVENGIHIYIPPMIDVNSLEGNDYQEVGVQEGLANRIQEWSDYINKAQLLIAESIVPRDAEAWVKILQAELTLDPKVNRVEDLGMGWNDPVKVINALTNAYSLQIQTTNESGLEQLENLAKNPNLVPTIVKTSSDFPYVEYLYKDHENATTHAILPTDDTAYLGHVVPMAEAFVRNYVTQEEELVEQYTRLLVIDIANRIFTDWAAEDGDWRKIWGIETCAVYRVPDSRTPGDLDSEWPILLEQRKVNFVNSEEGQLLEGREAELLENNPKWTQMYRETPGVFAFTVSDDEFETEPGNNDPDSRFRSLLSSMRVMAGNFTNRGSIINPEYTMQNGINPVTGEPVHPELEILKTCGPQGRGVKAITPTPPSTLTRISETVTPYFTRIIKTLTPTPPTEGTVTPTSTTEGTVTPTATKERTVTPSSTPEDTPTRPSTGTPTEAPTQPTNPSATPGNTPTLQPTPPNTPAPQETSTRPVETPTNPAATPTPFGGGSGIRGTVFFKHLSTRLVKYYYRIINT